MRLLEKVLPPVSYCSACGRPFFSAKRRPCRCGATARTFSRSVLDALRAEDKV